MRLRNKRSPRENKRLFDNMYTYKHTRMPTHNETYTEYKFTSLYARQKRNCLQTGIIIVYNSLCILLHE